MGDRPAAKKRSWSGQHGMERMNGSANGDSDRSSFPPRSDMEMDAMGSDESAFGDDEEVGLTNTDRAKGRRRRTPRNGSIAPGESASGAAAGGSSISAVAQETEKQKLVSAAILKTTIINALLIGLWYSFSISISVYNKWMFSKDNLNFPFPLFTTSVHMIVQFLLASGVLLCIPHLRPGADVKLEGKTEYTQLNNSAEEAHAQEEAGPDAPKPQMQQPLMTKTFYFTRIAPCGTATALDIGLGNFSLRYISLTFFTMCKSSVLAFVLLFAFLFGLESPTWRLCMIIVVMTVGVIMMVAGEAAFDAAGFGLVMSASLCSGFRWSLTQILLLRNRATSNPFSATFFLTPVMFLALFGLAIPVEGPANVVAGVSDLAKSKGGMYSFVILLFPGFLAFLMVSAEFALLKRTSVVTLSVCGIFKEVLTISTAGFIFGDELTPINVSGLIVTIASIGAYNWFKYTKMRKEAEEEVHEILEAEPGLVLRKNSDHGIAERRESQRSADGLMRDTLTAITTRDGGPESKAREISLSPVKRPEDLE